MGATTVWTQANIAAQLLTTNRAVFETMTGSNRLAERIENGLRIGEVMKPGEPRRWRRSHWSKTQALRRGQSRCYALLLTREEMEKWMDELARKYVETHDPVVK